MNKSAHRIYISILSIIVVIALAAIINKGYTYYRISMEERFFHPDHTTLKPSGLLGHGMGILGSFFMILGVSLYMARKRYRIFTRLGFLKHWLEFHIFLCTCCNQFLEYGCCISEWNHRSVYLFADTPKY